MQIDQIALILIIPNVLMLAYGLTGIFRNDSRNTIATSCLAISLAIIALVASVIMTYSWSLAMKLKHAYFAAYLPMSVFILVFAQHILRTKTALWKILISIVFSIIIFCVMAPYAAMLTACACGDCL